MRVYAVFDDPDAIQKARDAIEKEGRGDEVVEISSPQQSGDRGSDQGTVAPVMGSGQSISGPAIVGGFFAPVGGANLPDDEREHLEQILSGGSAQVLVLDVDDDDRDERMRMLKERGAEYVTSE